MVDTMQAYESLVIVVNGALGGEKKGGPPPGTVDALEARMNKALG